ncbi:hypothetical protein AMIS_52110 [Actinoplanes missouriensis 431]|uniref:Lipoprotein n=1 Tax=Actinoplanes missouriensis (strain ATCC 14538 / DSM 43046 / CBS 188.64 / JCM 3121 / NBRC 102363 / NCIMB 12654 / NRRL B-3342 / UNCC 431) TaxID=512565 RepID=I0HBP4_ACTM4|nr:hypothetical protein [Actinoplanes missouriensis]BAL90431.1 hypothetical protein AMIS_52110 [Actinoplanes missouriensis 431]
MTRTRGLLTAAAIPMLLLGACARPGAAGEAGAPGPVTGSPVTESAAVPADDAVVLRVHHRGGFVPPQFLVGRLPLVSVYADGRVITEGPTTLIYPGPALPNLQVARISPQQVKQLAAEAEKAGVKTGADFGTPGVADIPSTVVTVVTGYGTQTVDVVALNEAQPDDSALTAANRADRKKLKAFVDKLTGLGGTGAEPYRPRELAAIAQPWTDPGDGLGGEPVAWPGPQLPGEALNKAAGIHCVAVSGAQKDAVWAAASTANQRTAWTSGDKQWSVLFRPLLPDESGCGSLRSAE